jgi:hypothetical protein
MFSDQACGDSVIATAATRGKVLLSIILSSHTSVVCDLYRFQSDVFVHFLTIIILATDSLYLNLAMELISYIYRRFGLSINALSDPGQTKEPCMKEMGEVIYQ